MAQVLHAPAAFPGTPGPASPPAFPPRDPDPPYSVETPYGYRLDLDFLKYVDDIEKGHTLRRVPVQRRTRLGSLPRGPGSWWTSTESLCSNASADSRHSAYSYCGRGFYPQYGALETRAGGFNPRVERTLLDARRRLEAQAAAPPSLGSSSLTPSAAGSTSSLVGVGLPPPTPRGSGLSTPVAPSAGHLAHVREQMAGALRKLRQLEEQVKLIPVLQVKLSVLQEEKRQLTVQLKSQKFLGHPAGSRARAELCLDLPEAATEGTGPPETRSVGTWVRERDLGLPDGEAALAAKVAVLETQLQKALRELQAAQARVRPDGPVPADTVRVVEGPREVEVAASTQAGTPAQRAHSLEPYGAGLRALASASVGASVPASTESSGVFCSREVVETTLPLPTSPVTPSNVHVVKKISITERRCCPGEAGSPLEPSESSASFPASVAPLDSTAQGPTQDTASREPIRQATSSESETPRAPAGEPQATAVKSIMKRNEEPADPTTRRRSLQFVGVNGGYESSSEGSSTTENVSDNESTEGEAPDQAVAAGTRSSGQESQGCAPLTSNEGASALHTEDDIRMELSPELISACLALEKHLNTPTALTERELKAAKDTVLQEWLHLACHRDAHPELVRRHLVTFRAMSASLLDLVVNLPDGHGNTALHHCVSLGNFPVARQLLASGVCQVDRQNHAGYSPLMLTALATLRTQEDVDTVLQLFRLGDVNAKASQAGQTALMLAVSHGRADVVRALLACGANVNLQDLDGSTALMCACEHGRPDIAELLLAVPGCDLGLTDRDGSTALRVALDAGQGEIAALLYARMNGKCSFAPKANEDSTARAASSSSAGD